ncbi:MAG TPA: DUF2339 domain-containing protein [Chitinophagaceae bacterium]|nr:DUF2339 domain-containing protein [Chitinophagaceae bacterium]
MNQDPKIEELLKRIHEIAAEIEKSRQELARLYHEVKSLSPDEKKPSPPFKSSFPQRPPSSTFSLENFVGLKLIHFIGIIALVIGLAIGVKYAIDKNLISPLLRILLAYLAAAILFLISYRLRKKYRLFSLILFGGSVATGYFTTYSAFAYYQFLPLGVAFALMLLLAIFTVYYSIKYNSQELAILALVGGYGIPFLVRGSAENWIGLFSYILILNLAISFLSFKKHWTTLIYLSFAVTWLILLSSIYIRFERIGFETGFWFSVVFFLLFLVNTVAFNIVRKQALRLGDTFVILINIVLLYFAFLRLFEFQTFEEVALMTLIFGLVSLAFAFFLRIPGTQRLLQSGMVSFGLLMTIIYVPMQFEQLNITIIWVLMAALLFVLGLWKKYKLLRLVSIILFAVTLFKLVAIDSLNFTAIQKVIAYILLGSILLTVSFLYQKFKTIIFGEDD